MHRMLKYCYSTPRIVTAHHGQGISEYALPSNSSRLCGMFDRLLVYRSALKTFLRLLKLFSCRVNEKPGNSAFVEKSHSGDAKRSSEKYLAIA